MTSLCNSVTNVYVVVNFLSQVVFLFLLFQLHKHTSPYPKTKEKKILPITCDKKLTTAYTPNVECGMRKEYESILVIFCIILTWNPS